MAKERIDFAFGYYDNAGPDINGWSEFQKNTTFNGVPEITIKYNLNQKVR